MNVLTSTELYTREGTVLTSGAVGCRFAYIDAHGSSRV
jgi:hypothetical protein